MANKHQVSHWVHEERACVTVQRIIQTFNLSWPNALALLKEVPKEGHQYLVTRFTLSRNSDTSDSSSSKAFRLVKSSMGSSEKPNQTSVWYALALKVCTESMHTANEKDSSQFLCDMGCFSNPSLLCPPKSGNELESKGFASSIAVSESMKKRLTALGKRKAENVFGSQLPVHPKTASSFYVATNKTVITAHSFFSSGSKAKALRPSTASKVTFKGKATKWKPMSTPKQNHTSVLSQKAETTQSSKTKTAKEVFNEEKENVENKSSKVLDIASSKVGNADDICFDEEASSDEEVEAEAVHVPPDSDEQATVKDFSAKKSNSHFQDGEEGVDCQLKDDATILTMEMTRANKRRRKRKAMLEKTSVDESGYIYTETQTVWEDVPSSEDEHELVAGKNIAPQHLTDTSKKTTAKPKSMKQQSLMGFFKKK